MGQQSEIFSRYRSLFGSNSVPPSDSAASRQLDSLDFVDFLFELVKATKGQSQFKNIILKGSLSKLKQTDQLNNVIKNALISKYGCDSTLIITTPYTTKSSTGVSMTKAEVDNFGLLGIDPDGSPGRYLYEGNDVTKHINYVMYKAQGVTTNNPITFNYNGRVLFTICSDSPNTFLFKFGEYYENKTYGVWLTDYLAAASPIFNMVNFTTILTDLITGSISLTANKNKTEITQQSAIIKALQKLFGFCSEANTDSGIPNTSANNILGNTQNQNSNLTGTQTGFGQTLNTNNSTTTNNISGTNNSNTNAFNFSATDLAEIEADADLRSRGVINFVTCGNLELDIDPNEIMSGLDDLFNSANNDDLYSYDGTQNNQLPNTNGTTNSTSSSYDNSKIDPNPNSAANFFDQAIKTGAINAINSGESTVVMDMANMNAEIQLNILKAIPYALMQMILTPKVLLVPKLHAVLSGDNSTKSTQDFINSMSDIIQNIGSSITSLLIQNIFDSIKSDLTNLAKQLAVEFLKQRGLDYVATLSSLLSLLGLLSGSGGGCGGVLDTLLKLLKMGNVGPMPQLPSPLILVGGVLKPGLNKVSIFNDVKSNLNGKGVETAPTLPDGTPNNMIIAIEATIDVIINHIKTNSTIQTFALGATGPVQGYGQMQ